MRRVLMKQNVWFTISLFLVIVSCTTAKPTLEWRDQNYNGGPFENILIVGMADQETVRRTFENTFVERLKQDNIKATASFAVLPSEARPTEESIRAVIADIKFDSILFTHMVGIEEGEVYHPPSYSGRPYGGMYGYYGHVGGYMYEPGYYSKYTTVRLETMLYDTQTEDMVWSMQSETMNPSSDKELINAKIKTVIKLLKSQKLIVGK